MQVVVTGATGHVGAALVRDSVPALGRSDGALLGAGAGLSYERSKALAEREVLGASRRE